MTTRTYEIYSRCDPAISGFGGFDAWTLENLTSEEADRFFAMLDAIVKNAAVMFKKDCYYSGVN